ncbi:MAG: M42 family metallopeptidase [Candidatus Aureabacteria bacterium]|nr:M42 family metallopeptidase [Candidatus Auribacterota bacterium]
MEKEPLEFLKKLADAVSPSGFEEDASLIWKERTEKFADSVKKDVHGNTIAVLQRDDNMKVMLAGHIDEIGYMVKFIDEQGYIYFSTVGGIDLHLVPGQRVVIKTQKGKVLGVVGKKPIHVLEDEERKKVSKIDQLWIDIGSKSEKETKKIVDIGDVAVPAVGFEILRSDIVIGRGFDDKAGAFVVSEALRLLSNKKNLKASVYSVGTVQEEIGLRGARTSCFGISPDVGIAVDVTFATDFPGMEKKKVGDIQIGKGPVIARGPNINPKVFDIIVAAAKSSKIPYQIEGISRATGTDANVIQLTKSGVATGLVSIPLRYMHTPVELLSLKDLVNTAKLLCAVITRLSKKTSFII